jgi:hypothetical protein
MYCRCRTLTIVVMSGHWILSQVGTRSLHRPDDRHFRLGAPTVSKIQKCSRWRVITSLFYSFRKVLFIFCPQRTIEKGTWQPIQCVSTSGRQVTWWGRIGLLLLMHPPTPPHFNSVRPLEVFDKAYGNTGALHLIQKYFWDSNSTAWILALSFTSAADPVEPGIPDPDQDPVSLETVFSSFYRCTF